MRTSNLSINIIDRLTLQNYEIQPQYQQINLKLNCFNFTDVFDLVAQVPLDKAPKVSSHSFIEFFVDVNGKPFQVAVGFLEDFVSNKHADKFTIQANGRSLMGQLMYSNFKTTLYSEDTEMGAFVNLALKNEYLEIYNKYKSRAGMIIDKNYNRSEFLASSDQFQMKGQLIERFAKLGCILCFQDRLGRVVLLSESFEMPDPKGRLIWAKDRSNIQNLVIRNSFSEVYSDATVFYTQSQALVDANTTNSIQYKNTDPRVNGIINRPLYETLNVSDVRHFAGKVLPEKRMAQIAKSMIRKSNRKVNQVIVTTDTPYFFDSVKKEFIPYEFLQVWEIESDQNDLTSPESPNGTNLVKMILTGIDYSGTENDLSVQLQFSEFETLI